MDIAVNFSPLFCGRRCFVLNCVGKVTKQRWWWVHALCDSAGWVAWFPSTTGGFSGKLNLKLCIHLSGFPVVVPTFCLTPKFLENWKPDIQATVEPNLMKNPTGRWGILSYHAAPNAFNQHKTPKWKHSKVKMKLKTWPETQEQTQKLKTIRQSYNRIKVEFVF